ncbi:hypothetical protein PVBG_04775 [Plasmodium vivax Brazil I]|uniref:Variable surface protein n=1 Tax=Plasmodium vivax (strain Brazil I) TaxID=1033975 RepID=A0A0J9T0K8_PLAV1|nr:hypothetical protein PVBG_04775 [Plasmodium vivax Brazil I]
MNIHKIKTFLNIINKIYPFFNNVLTMYDEFDSHVDGDINERNYDFMCDHIVKTSNGELKKHKNICIKLMRNLGHRSSNSKFLYPTHDRCNVLYNWIYNSINKHSIPRDVIVKCYDDYTTIKKVRHNENICPYYSYDDIYEEPINIIMLKIFESNVDILISTLNEEKNPFTSSCQKYVCELVKIYNDMYSKFCAKRTEWGAKREKTCDILNKFYDIYKLFFFVNLQNTNKIPSPENIENDYLVKCTSHKPQMGLTSEGRTNPDTLIRMGMPATDEDSEGKLEENLPISLGNEGNSMKKSITTTIGTVAGASTILTLLYKVNRNFYFN